MLPTISELSRQLDAGTVTATELAQAALARIGDPEGEGSKTFTESWSEQALAAARASDTLRAAGLRRSPIDGLPISVKDLFDIAGRTTLAGSVARQGAPVAQKNAV